MNERRSAGPHHLRSIEQTDPTPSGVTTPARISCWPGSQVRATSLETTAVVRSRSERRFVQQLFWGFARPLGGDIVCFTQLSEAAASPRGVRVGSPYPHTYMHACYAHAYVQCKHAHNQNTCARSRYDRPSAVIAPPCLPYCSSTLVVGHHNLVLTCLVLCVRLAAARAPFTGEW